MSIKLQSPIADKNERIDEFIELYCTDPAMAGFRKSVNARKYNVSHTGVNYRIIGNWEECNLLPNSMRESNGWRKFTFIEIVWLKVIKRLRSFGLPLEQIAVTKELVMKWVEETETYNEFEFYVYMAWKSKHDPYVAVMPNGEAEVAYMPEIFRGMDYFGRRDLILISLTSILEEMRIDVSEKYEFSSLAPEDKELLSELHSGGDKEVKVKVRNGKMVDMESLSTIKALLAKETKKQMKEQLEYGSILTQFENGIEKSVTTIKKRRFKK